MMRNVIFIGMSVFVLAVLIGGFFLGKSALNSLAAQPSSTPTKTPSASPSPSPSPSASPSPSQVSITAPSPSPTGPPDGPRPCRYEGKKYTESQVKSALETAARYEVWRTVKITVPADLVKAVARHESGWQ